MKQAISLIVFAFVADLFHFTAAIDQLVSLLDVGKLFHVPLLILVVET